MRGRRHHYERAFEAYLRDRRIPYVSVDDARKALLPDRAGLRMLPPQKPDAPDGGRGRTLKSFDFTIYGDQGNLLIEVKGRKIPRSRHGGGGGGTRPVSRRRLECWVTREDLDALQVWQRLFGEGFEAAFCFCYWCEEQPPDGLFQELIVHKERWYAIRAIRLDDYLSAVRVRSPRWGTFDLSVDDFEALSHPLAPPRLDGGGDRGAGGGGDVGPKVPALEPIVAGNPL